MHHVYTTPAFVVHSSPYGEAGKFLLLFTRDFGMVGAIAQGIRLSQSKLRYHTQDGSYLNVSIVRGKEIWRLTGAHELDYEKNNILQLKILKLLKRLLHGEERNEKLFGVVFELYKTKVREDDLGIVEGLTVLRILNTLGYIQRTHELSVFLEDNSIRLEIIEQYNSKKDIMINIINSALKESQL